MSMVNVAKRESNDIFVYLGTLIKYDTSVSAITHLIDRKYGIIEILEMEK